MIILKEELRRTVEWYRYEETCWALYAEMEINMEDPGRRAHARKQALMHNLTKEQIEKSYRIVDKKW